MTNHGTYTTKIDCWICIEAKERSLKDSCWEHNLVVHRAVISIDCLWSHTPAGFVHLLSYIGQVFLIAPCTDLTYIVKIRSRRSRRNIQLRIVCPLIRISNLNPKLIEFCQCFFFGLRGHPIHLIDM